MLKDTDADTVAALCTISSCCRFIKKKSENIHFSGSQFAALENAHNHSEEKPTHKQT